MISVTTIFVVDLNRKPLSVDPTDEELQDAKLLYYYPDHCEIEERRSHFGLIEGLIGLISTFTTNKIDFLKTKLFTTTVSEWYPGVYLVVCFKDDEKHSSEMLEYSHSWKHLINKIVLENAKRIFELLYGPLNEHLELATSSGNLDDLRIAFDNFLPSFLTKSVSSSFNILKDWDATNKAHINSAFALDAQTLITDICLEFNEVKEYLLIYNREIFLSSLDIDDMMVIYTFLIKHEGSVTKDAESRVKTLTPTVSNEVHVLESDTGVAFGPRVRVKGRDYYLSALCFGGLILILLLDSRDIVLSLNNIKEYLNGIPHGLKALLRSISNPSSSSKLRTLSLNSTTKTIRSIGYEPLDDKKLRELYIIRGIHHLIESNAAHLNRVDVKTSDGWICSQVSNDREMYLSLSSDRLGLTAVTQTFDDFVKSHLGGIYFI
ncbi:hypothetical protein BBOV_III007810 [Babesia bovis T2Bo]|uniref:CCZ1/INTU/HSP4 first Longin domain-containing protein n=1 Tax=Babesia bovis TaxID=5865 RepID=A7AP57_BABBO|nr:hypothetical protein BBOV_III007810 [Babesia bovis T2Bo]EDO08341.1 hypothetical protein BBOV_III007810 [Babesia bovis T2Bo]|eukprot:XP_001611909.1 hypothetical protein [Babesia bovis T2Bo]